MVFITFIAVYAITSIIVLTLYLIYRHEVNSEKQRKIREDRKLMEQILIDE